jgi:hypothetical protein
MAVFNHPATVTETPRAAVLTGEPALVVRLRDVLDRLEALPPALRGLVQACAENRLDGDLLGFLADYLDEHGMQGGERVRLLRPVEGDVLVIWPHGEISPAVLPDMRATAERLTREYGMTIPGSRLEPLTPASFAPPAGCGSRSFGWPMRGVRRSASGLPR